ncbi:hypothetical protein [Halobacteriovorax sp. JY17]|uniref:hypothetical protein n=1 Tax=Halobacteriovorax sp. JY17 TaxID=2014617 RepID=UPI000C3DB747|nr:hypothetical protein [Halobacteriovorax sp. JY17]PIK16503.1 MAG: hypothetical protein CES88_07120 [Halobacteriovorax sp. JY17]
MKENKAAEEKKRFLIHLSFILFYFFLCWAVYLIVSSVITFFHLQLDHSLNIVENWNFDQGWEIASFVKIIAFFIISKFISIRSTSRKPLRTFFLDNYSAPKRNLLTLIVFNLVFAILFLKPIVAERVTFEFFKIFSSYFGSLIYIFSEVIFLLFLQNIYKVSKTKRNIETILFITLSYILNVHVFTHSSFALASLPFYLILCFSSSYWREESWSYPLLILAIFICPLISLFGVDFIWGSDFSYLMPMQAPNLLLFVVLTLVSTGYMIYLKRKNSDLEDQV